MEKLVRADRMDEYLLISGSQANGRDHEKVVQGEFLQKCQKGRDLQGVRDFGRYHKENHLCQV